MQYKCRARNYHPISRSPSRLSSLDVQLSQEGQTAPHLSVMLPTTAASLSREAGLLTFLANWPSDQPVSGWGNSMPVPTATKTRRPRFALNVYAMSSIEMANPRGSPHSVTQTNVPSRKEPRGVHTASTDSKIENTQKINIRAKAAAIQREYYSSVPTGKTGFFGAARHNTFHQRIYILKFKEIYDEAVPASAYATESAATVVYGSGSQPAMM